MVNQIVGAFIGDLSIVGLIVAIVIVIAFLYLLFRPYKEPSTLTEKVKVK